MLLKNKRVFEKVMVADHKVLHGMKEIGMGEVF